MGTPGRLSSIQALCTILSALLLWSAQPRLLAQDAAAEPTSLEIVIVEGEGAVDNIRQRTAREPIVQVQDQNRKPVAGAVVTFLLPGNGPSGTFANGLRTLTVTTDQTGRAVATGFQPNTVAGKVNMRVNATFRNQTTSRTISSTNVAQAGAAAGAAGISAKLIWTLVGVGAAAAAGGAIAATRGGGNNTPRTTPTVITPGTPTVGAPR